MRADVRLKAASMLAAAGIIAGCGGSAGSQPAAPASTSTTAAPAATATVSSCTSRAYSWAHQGGGAAQMGAIARDATKIFRAEQAVAAALKSGAGSSGPLARLTAVASQLGADTQTALANQPPGCIPGEAAPYRAALAEYNQASQDLLSAAGDSTSGSFAAAIPLLNAATTAMDKGTADISKASAAISAFSAAG